MRWGIHQHLIAECTKNDWKTGNWKAEAKKLFTQDDEWAKENYENCFLNFIVNLNIRPDVWKFYKSNNPNESLLQISFMEICVSSQIPCNKLATYLNLYWMCESTENLNFNFYKMDQYGNISNMIPSVEKALWYETNWRHFNKDY